VEPNITWRDMPVIIFGIVGIASGLVSLTQLGCVALSCRQQDAFLLTFPIVVVVGVFQLLYLRFWRVHKMRTLQVTLAGYVITIIAIVVLLRRA
jgi:hypothetical protein